MTEKIINRIGLIFAIIPIIPMIISFVFWPSNIFFEEIIKQLDLYYNSSIIMDISTNCDNKSNNILGSFGGIPEGRTYLEKPQSQCPANPFNYFIGKCIENQLIDYDYCENTPI